jgi:hypothetical protein
VQRVEINVDSNEGTPAGDPLCQPVGLEELERPLYGLVVHAVLLHQLLDGREAVPRGQVTPRDSDPQLVSDLLVLGPGIVRVQAHLPTVDGGLTGPRLSVETLPNPIKLISMGFNGLNEARGCMSRRPRHEMDDQELVDAIVAAIDLDRSTEVDRVQIALGPFGLADMFSEELRLSGVPSATWELCPLCSDVLEALDAEVMA